jgi:DNA-binding transcriptional regulator YiaG
MTKEELDALLERHGLTRAAAARLVGRDVRSVRRWLEGTRRMSDADAAILRLLDRGHVSRKRLQSAISGGSR